MKNLTLALLLVLKIFTLDAGSQSLPEPGESVLKMSRVLVNRADGDHGGIGQTNTNTSLAFQDEVFMAQALELARLAVKHGNHPFGAVLVKDGKVVASAENTVLTDKARSRHAELNLIDKALRDLEVKSLEGYTIYTSTEPCLTCGGAILLAKVSAVVYGAPHKFLAKLLPGYPDIGLAEMARLFGQVISVRGPVMREQSEKILSEFVSEHRNRVRH